MGIRWSEAATKDIEAIFSQIAADSPQNALLVDDRIEQQTQYLAEFPELGRTGRRGLRELVIHKTPYIVFYRVAEGDVEIIAVVHGKKKLPSEARTS